MSELRFAILGAGFWSHYQLAAWHEISDVRCVAIYNRTLSKAQALASRFGVERCYDDAESLFEREELDFVDIITDGSTHCEFVLMAARHQFPVICQKPMAGSLDEARTMIDAAKRAGIPLLVHENWRWQAPLREVKRLLNCGEIGAVFRGRMQYSNSFPVFDNQPFLREIDQFILTDIGTHILDAARFLFGEASTIACHTNRVHQDIRGEDVATVLMRMQSGATVTCEMSYASRLEYERFPETFLLIEGDRGSIELTGDYWVRLTNEQGTHSRRIVPPRYEWADPRYELIHASIVPCHQNLVDGLRGVADAETTGDDNFKTLQLVYGAYESAVARKTVILS